MWPIFLAALQTHPETPFGTLDTSWRWKKGRRKYTHANTCGENSDDNDDDDDVGDGDGDDAADDHEHDGAGDEDVDGDDDDDGDKDINGDGDSGKDVNVDGKDNYQLLRCRQLKRCFATWAGARFR